MTVDVTPDLARAERALERGERAAALDQLLATWSTCRAPAIADAIDVVSADVARSSPPIGGATAGARHVAWRALCEQGRASDVPILLAELARPHEGAPDVLDRLTLLERLHGADPRVAERVMRLLCGGIPWNQGPLWSVVFRMLAAIGDRRGLAILRPFLARDRAVRHDHEGLSGGQLRRIPAHFPRMYSRMESLAAALDTPAPVLSEETRVALERIANHARSFAAAPPPALARAPAAPPARTEEELLGLVWANPDDDAPRHVYADWCAERGLARGELIALSLLPTRTRPQDKRLRELVKAHGHELLGPLAPVVNGRSVELARGFPSSCEVRFRTAEQRVLATHPAWSTVTTLTTDDPQVVQSARSLRVLHLAPRLLRRLAEGPALPVSALRLRLESWPIAPEVRAALARSSAFPRLVDFQTGAEPSGEPIGTDGFAWIFDCPFGPQLRRFAVAKDPALGAGVDLAAWVRVLPRTLTVASFASFGFDVELTRADDGRFRIGVTLTAPLAVTHVAPVLAGSLLGLEPARVASVVVRTGRPLDPADRRALEEAGGSCPVVIDATVT